jgi:transposase
VLLFGHAISLWDSYGLAGLEMGSGSVNEDSRGRRYLNVTVSIPDFVSPPTVDQFTHSQQSIGIDLGLKDFLATSSGIKVQAQQFYRGAQAKLATAQRANKKRWVKTIHCQIANRRKDFQHKLSTTLVKQSGAIFVGNVNASGLAKTRMAKRSGRRLESVQGHAQGKMRSRRCHVRNCR